MPDVAVHEAERLAHLRTILVERHEIDRLGHARINGYVGPTVYHSYPEGVRERETAAQYHGVSLLAPLKHSPGLRRRYHQAVGALLVLCRCCRDAAALNMAEEAVVVDRAALVRWRRAITVAFGLGGITVAAWGRGSRPSKGNSASGQPRSGSSLPA